MKFRIKVLLSYGAPQFKKLTEEQALCWIHDAGNYKKLEPIVPLHKKELEDYLSRYWNYYWPHTMTEEGTKASDTFMTIVQTAKKLGVSAYDYISDRVSKSFKMPSLAELIGAKQSLTFD